MDTIVDNTNNIDFSLEPIVALSSGACPSGVAVIRVSGKGCIDIVLSFLSNRDRIQKEGIKERFLYYTRFVDPSSSDDVIDEVMVSFFKSPRSYTGEDCCEISCHGGVYIVDTIISKLISTGKIRLALAGEFTKRAYLNSKIDLAKAESIKELIEAVSYEGWLCASDKIQSRLKSRILELKQELINVLSLLEGRIDFPDEESSAVDSSFIIEASKKVYSMILDLLSTFRSGYITQNGLKIALIGEPNAGKSSLSNILLQKERSIVSDISGTTRDYIEDHCFIGSKLVKIIDTAGIKQNSEDKIENIGINRSLEKIYESDLVLLVMSVDTKVSSYFLSILEDIKKKNISYIPVITKVDLMDKDNKDVDIDTNYKNIIKYVENPIKVSCISNEGIDELKNKIISCIDKHTEVVKKDVAIFSLRHKTSLENAKNYLETFFNEIDSNVYDECLALDIQLAIRALESIIGTVESNEVLNKIFDSFCIGK